VRRPAATGRGRSRARHRARADPRGRTHRQPRQPRRRRGHRPAPRAAPGGPDGRAHHPRPGGRAIGRPPDPPARRPDRRVSAFELLRLALSRLRTSRLRAALTMLGVIIGVASVVALVGVGQGTTSSITTRLAALGTNLLTISPTSQNSDGSTSLTLEDADAIAGLDAVAGVAPEVTTNLDVTAADKSTSTTVIGTTAAYTSVRAYEVWQGSFLTDVSVDRGLRVAVLGASTARTLGLDATDL